MQFKLLLSFALFVMVAASCTKTKLATPAPDTPEMAEARSAIESTNATLMGNTWKIASCIEQGIDLTAKYDRYNISFASNGTLTAADGFTKLQGKWVTSYIDEKVRINFIFQNNPVFISVDGNWTITEKNAQTIRMLDAIHLVDALSLTKK